MYFSLTIVSDLCLSAKTDEVLKAKVAQREEEARKKIEEGN